MADRPPLKALSAFEAAYRHGSFARAAEELLVTPSAISHQIRLLEDVLEVRLFERLDRGVAPTETARHYFDEVAAAFRGIEGATRRIRGGAAASGLRVHANPSFANQWLLPQLSAWLQEYPTIELDIQATHGPANPATDEVDLDIRYGRYPAPHMYLLPLAREYVVPLISPALLPADGRALGVADLPALRPIHSEKCLVQWDDWAAQVASAELDFSQGPRFDRSYMAIRSAVDGVGVCLESTLLARAEIARGQLVMPLGPEAGVPLIGHFLAVPEGKAATPAVRTFLGWLERLLADHADHYEAFPLDQDAIRLTPSDR